MHNFTEEAFLLTSLQEVVKVWARGTGQASFAVNVENGVAKLDMSFSLGHPSDLHCQLPQRPVPVVPHPSIVTMTKQGTVL